MGISIILVVKYWIIREKKIRFWNQFSWEISLGSRSFSKAFLVILLMLFVSF